MGKPKIKAPKLIGDPIMLMNLSGTDQFCVATGKKLPRRGIAFRHNDKLYINRGAIPRVDD